MNDRQKTRLVALFALGSLLCMASVTYFDVPKLYAIQHEGVGVIDSAILWSGIIGMLIGLAIRQTAAAAVVGLVVGLSLAMLGCSMGPTPIRE